MSDTPKQDAQATPEAGSSEQEEYDHEWDLLDAGDQTKKLPARFANRMFVSPEGQHLRIAFGEKIAEDNVYHTALVVPNGEALEMAKLLFNMAQTSVNAQVHHLRSLADSLERIGEGFGEPNV